MRLIRKRVAWERWGISEEEPEKLASYFDLRSGVNPLDNFTEVGCLRAFHDVSRPGRADFHHQHLLGRESSRTNVHEPETLQHQSSAGQQNDRQRKLTCDQQLADT